MIRPLVAMMSSNAESRHYAGLALLKLADNFENHLAISQQGGIQALLRLGRSRTTDEQLQYKAALTVGHLATNAVRLLPTYGSTLSSGSQPNAGASAIGAGAQMMTKIRAEQAVEKGRKSTREYMERVVEGKDRKPGSGGNSSL